MSRSIASYGAEADVCNAFIDFLESTWVFRSEYTEQKEKQVKYEALAFPTLLFPIDIMRIMSIESHPSFCKYLIRYIPHHNDSHDCFFNV